MVAEDIYITLRLGDVLGTACRGDVLKKADEHRHGIGSEARKVLEKAFGRPGVDVRIDGIIGVCYYRLRRHGAHRESEYREGKHGAMA